MPTVEIPSTPSISTARITIGEAAAYPTGLELIRFPNLDGDIAANWGVWQRWFPTGLSRNDPMLFVGYNGHEESDRADVTEPGWFLQMESNDVAADGVTQLLAGGLTIIRLDGTVSRPIYASVIKSTGVSDLSFSNRFTIFDDQDDHHLLHLAYGSSHAVGIGTVCNSNANFHVLGRNLWESNLGTATADGKKWDWAFGGMAGSGDGLAFRAVTDNYGAAAAVFEISRSGAVVAGVRFTPPVELAGGLANLPVYADNAAAAALAVGQIYRTSTGVLMVRY